jgi:hypothetical protein
VASEQVLDASVQANIQRAATKVTDRRIGSLEFSVFDYGRDKEIIFAFFVPMEKRGECYVID